MTDGRVTVTGSPALTLSNGGTAPFLAVDTDGHATFRYTAQAGDDTPNVQVTGLDLAGGAILGAGQVSFATAASYTVDLAYNLATADLNGDGRLDIVTEYPRVCWDLGFSRADGCDSSSGWTD